jgi:hypothetical protein
VACASMGFSSCSKETGLAVVVMAISDKCCLATGMRAVPDRLFRKWTQT